MILSKDIAFSELCPIEFTQQKELNFYPEQGEFIGSISNNTFFQCRISQSLYNAKSNLVLIMRNLNEVINTFYLSKSKLTKVDAGANNHYYGTCWILPSDYVGKVYFEVWDLSTLVDSFTSIDFDLVGITDFTAIKLNFVSGYPNIRFEYTTIPNKRYQIFFYDENGNVWGNPLQGMDSGIINTSSPKNSSWSLSYTLNQKLSVRIYDGDVLIANCGLTNFLDTTYTQDNLDADASAYSLVYNINPEYDECLKTIEYSHKKNDFETIFNELMTVVDVPVISEPNILSIKLNFATTFNNISFTFQAVPNKAYTIILKDSNDTLYSTNTTSSIGTTTFEKAIGTAVNQHGQTLYVEVYDGTTLVAKSELYTFNAVGGTQDSTYNYYRTNSFKISLDATFVPSNLSLKNKRNDFDKQNYTNNPVSSVPYNTEKLTFGSGLGIPNWLAVKLNAIFSLSNTTIGNTQYFVASGANLELRDGSYDGLGIYDIELQKENDFLQIDSTSTGHFDNSFNPLFD